MSIYKKYEKDMILNADFRTGTFIDRSGVHTLINQGSVVSKNKIVFADVSKFIRVGPAGSLNIGLSDFTVLAKFKMSSVIPDFSAIIGDAAGFNGFTALRVQPVSNKAASMKFNGTLVPDSSINFLKLNEKNTIAYTADRDGFMKWFRDGVFYYQYDISSGVSVDLKTIGNCDIARYGNDNLFNYVGDIDYVIVIKALLSATEISVLTNELKEWPNQIVESSAVYEEPEIINANEIADGDMEAPGTTAWIAANNAVLSKDTVTFQGGKQSLKVAVGPAGTQFPIARQSTLIIGRNYHVRCWVWLPTPLGAYRTRLCLGTGYIGVATPGWSYIDAKIVCVGNNNFDVLFIGTPLAGEYTLIEDLYIQEVGKVYKKIYYKGESGAIANEITISSGFLENLDAKILSGSFKVTTTLVNGLLRKNIVSVTSGSLYFTKMSQLLTGVSRYIDDVHVTTDLAAARTISLTAGQTMIYWCEDENLSFYQAKV